MAALDIADGYTLPDVTPDRDDDGRPLPTVSYAYRPAMPEELYEWRFRLKMARSGKEELDATAEFIAKHVVRWDVLENRKIAKVTAAIARKLPEPIQVRMCQKIATWAGKPEPGEDGQPGPTAHEEAEKN